MSALKYTDIMKPEDISIAHCWTTFAGLVLSGVSDIQRSEMRKAFYAGFTECFKIHIDISTTLSETEAVATLSRLNDEANEFVDAFLKEKS